MHDILGTSIEKRQSLTLNSPIVSNETNLKLKDTQHRMGSSAKKRKLNNKQTLNSSNSENKPTLTLNMIDDRNNLSLNSNKINNVVTQNNNCDYYISQNQTNHHLHHNLDSHQPIDSYVYSYEQHGNNNNTYSYQYQYEYY